MNAREKTIGGVLLAFAVIFGVYPQAVFRYMTPSVNATVDQLTEWTKRNHPAAEPQTEQETEVTQAPKAGD